MYVTCYGQKLLFTIFSHITGTPSCSSAGKATRMKDLPFQLSRNPSQGLQKRQLVTWTSATTIPLKQAYPLPPQMERTMIIQQKRNLTLMTMFAWTILQLKSMGSVPLKMKAVMVIHFCENLRVQLNVSASLLLRAKSLIL